MKNEDRAGSGNQTEQASSVPATQVCACSARKALKKMLCHGSQAYREQVAKEARTALSAPCPCEQLREESARLHEVANRFRDPSGALGLGDMLNPLAFMEVLLGGMRKVQAERDSLRALLDEAREALARIAGEIPHASASRSARRNIALAALTKIDAARKPEAALRERTTLTPPEER